MNDTNQVKVIEVFQESINELDDEITAKFVQLDLLIPIKAK